MRVIRRKAFFKETSWNVHVPKDVTERGRNAIDDYTVDSPSALKKFHLIL